MISRQLFSSVMETLAPPLLLISVCHQEFALPISEILASCPAEKLIRTGNLPGIFAGFLRKDSGLFPIINLCALFRVNPPLALSGLGPPNATALVVEVPTGLAGESKSFGLLVDQVLGQYEVNSLDLHQVYGHFMLDCVEFNARIESHFFPVISPIQLLEEIEEYCLSHFSLFNPEAEKLVDGKSRI